MTPVSILMYHSVGARQNPAYDRWCVSPQRFRDQMSALAESGYAVLTTGDYVDRLASGAALPDRFVVLTFDDGLQDFLTGAAPILGRFGFPATVYVVAGRVGLTSRWLAPLGEGHRPMLTTDELRQLARSGIEIGGHTMTHPELDILDPARAMAEIGGSRRVLEDILGSPVRSFAYPHGYNSARTRAIVERAGYQSAVRVRHAHSERSECRFGLSRLIITEDLDPQRFMRLIGGPERVVAPPQDRLIADLWRSTRRLRHWRDQRALAG
ncbi:MAG: polysaccharide deacetylase family protein [Rhodobacteraceae bacterium]|jgi:peptidoglycan/xylan/chitin deacetylase (PgdA/CDA1 family)|nr:polysaccharide deacetylase family protein [Paracoccaceae bacterium]